MAPTTRSKAKKENVSKDVAEAGSVFFQVLENYFDTAPTRIRLIDTFLLFLMIIGIQQFVFCLIFGTYPFNGFLAGFCSAVGQFVLTAALRIQFQKHNQPQFPFVSPERAFADYTFGSLLLHFMVYHFLN